MPFSIACPHCHRSMRANAPAERFKVRCPECGATLAVTVEDGHARASVADPPPAALPVAGRADEPAFELAEDDTGSDFEPITCTVTVLADSEGELKGSFEGKIAPGGLFLSKRKELWLDVPVGTPTEYLGKGDLEADLDGRRLKLRLVKQRAYVRRLAEDAAEFLSGRVQGLEPADYVMPAWLLAVAFLPVVLVAVGGAVGGGIGGLAIGVNVVVAQRDGLPLAARVGVMLGTTVLAVVGYLVVATLLFGGVGFNFGR
jgi:hypothetical protein